MYSSWQTNAFDQSMFQSQDEYIGTPRETAEEHFKLCNQAVSPQRKKRSRFIGAMSLSGSRSFIHTQSKSYPDYRFLLPIEKKEDNEGPTCLFGLSQDDAMIRSQSSQDFSDRFGQQLCVKGKEDSIIDGSNSNISHLCYHNETVNSDGFQAPQIPKHKSGIPLPTSGTKLNEDGANGNSKSALAPIVETSRQITLPPTTLNPFLVRAAKTRTTPPTHLWISSFKERPHYLSDFLQEGVLGVGAFSVVYAARKRLDGVLYAVKKVKTVVQCEADHKSVIKEVCALAALQGCPYIVQYFNSWVDDHKLYIQTELCALGTLDALITQTYGLLAAAAERPHLYRTESFDLVKSSQFSSISCRPQSSFLIGQRSDSQSNCSTARHNLANELKSPNKSVSVSYTTSMEVQSLVAASGENSLSAVEQAVWVILGSMAGALKYMHRRGIAHMDIRPANMFLAALSNSLEDAENKENRCSSDAANGRPHSLTSATGASKGKRDTMTFLRMIIQHECVVKLGDFGLACRVDHVGEIEEGESRYCAREVINGNLPIDLRAADIFSLGASVYEIVLGRQLGSGGDHGSQEWHNIRDGLLDDSFMKSNRYSVQLTEVVASMVRPDPSNRPTATKVVELASQYFHVPLF